MQGTDFPTVHAPLPGPGSRALTARLQAVESPNVTYVGGAYPVFWKRARGANVEDVDGNVFIDMTSAFGVMGIGHSHPRVVEAIEKQARELVHGMGDVHPTALKVELAEDLRDLLPGDLSQIMFSSSGAEAVEAALKTARIYTGRPGVIAFEGGYHGLTYGTLAVTHQENFRRPFADQLGSFVTHFPFPDSYRDADPGLQKTRSLLYQIDRRIFFPKPGEPEIGALLIEPIQGRGGIVVPPPGFLAELEKLCRRRGVLLIFDEIMTGFGRTGHWFACEAESVTPDLIVLGKGMTGGFPISACAGRSDIMARWGVSAGEAIHTSTFLGSPLGCAAARATLRVLKEEKLIERSARLGHELIKKLAELEETSPLIGQVRGRGLMIGVEMVKDRTTRSPASEEAYKLAEALLEEGILVLLAGPHRNVLSLTPPFVITEDQLDFFMRALAKHVRALKPVGTAGAV